jgi:hypothetical protein
MRINVVWWVAAAAVGVALWLAPVWGMLLLIPWRRSCNPAKALLIAS